MTISSLPTVVFTMYKNECQKTNGLFCCQPNTMEAYGVSFVVPTDLKNYIKSQYTIFHTTSFQKQNFHFLWIVHTLNWTDLELLSIKEMTVKKKTVRLCIMQSIHINKHILSFYDKPNLCRAGMDVLCVSLTQWNLIAQLQLKLLTQIGWCKIYSL